MKMKTLGSTTLAVAGAFALLPLAACHIYVDEPAKTAPPPPPARPAPVAKKVIPLRVHRLGTPASPATPNTPATPATPALTAASCLDTGPATIGDCTTVQAPSTCTAPPTPQQKCAAYKTYFVPKVAAAAVSCMVGLSSAAACDATTTTNCARAALNEACPQSTLAQLCQIAATPCKTTVADCSEELSGLNDQGQQLVAQCVATGCAAGLEACVDALATH